MSEFCAYAGLSCDMFAVWCIVFVCFFIVVLVDAEFFFCILDGSSYFVVEMPRLMSDFAVLYMCDRPKS